MDGQTGDALPWLGAVMEPPSGAHEAHTAASAAADEAYCAHAPLLRAIALRRFQIPVADVDALVHDVFASYFMNAAQVMELRRYLVGAICNASRQYWRRHEAERAVFCDGMDCSAIAAENDLSEEIARRMTIAAILARLRPGCRELMRRYYLEGESTASIAAHRATTSNSVLVLRMVAASPRAPSIARSSRNEDAASERRGVGIFRNGTCNRAAADRPACRRLPGLPNGSRGVSRGRRRPLQC
ncbi:MAG: sigma-70 family RNA polymerase sigma factor [Acidobacteria bacterium]|nr:sigma-70 family RNA polymerase sigma factor [Acidobacteriota bacterium]